MTVDIATLGIRIDATETRLAAIELDRLRTHGASAERQLGNTERAARSLGSGFSMLRNIIGVLGLAAVARDILATNREMESLRARLIAVTGSAQQAAQAFSFIQQFAKTTPFEISGITKAYLTLQNFGLKPTAEVMEAVTKASAKTGASAESLQGISLALGQAWGKAKLQGQEILQLINQSVPIYELLAQATGKNSDELIIMAEKGELNRGVIMKVIQAMGENKNGVDANAEAMKTLNGKISSLSDAWHTFEDTLLQDKSEGLIKSIVGGITESLDILSNAMDDSANARIAHLKDVITFQNQLRSYFGMDPVAHTGEEAEIKGLTEEMKRAGEETAKLKDNMVKFNAAAEKSAKLTSIYNEELERVSLAKTRATKGEIEAYSQELKSKGLADDQIKNLVAIKQATLEASEATKSHHKTAVTSHKAVTVAISEEERAAKALQESYKNEIESLINHNAQLSQSARDYAITTLKAKDFDDAMVSEAMRIWDVNAAWEAKKKVNEAELNALDELMDKYHQLTLSAREYFELQLVKKGIPSDERAPILAQFDQNANVQAQQQQLDGFKQQYQDLKTEVDNYSGSINDANDATQGLTDVTSALFDSTSDAFSKLVGVFTNLTKITANYGKALADNQKKLDNAFLIDNEKEYQKLLKDRNKIQEAQLADTLGGFRQMAGAASQMFEEQSAGRKALHNLELVFGAVELAIRLKNMVALAGEAILTQGKGDPYSAFARIAAMTAIVAGVVAAAGGAFSAGGNAAKPPTGNTGTGTVLGAPEDVSDSANKTYELLKDIHASEYVELRGINKGVKDLHDAIAGTVNTIFSTDKLGAGIYDPNIDLSVKQKNPLNSFTAGALTSGISNDPGVRILSNLLFGGKITKKIVGGGIATAPISIEDILAGGSVGAAQYNIVQTTKKGGLFTKTKTSFDTILTEINSDVQESLTKIFKSASETMIGLADSLGAGLSDRVKNYTIPTIMLELRGLSGEDAAKKLNGVISATLDTMAEGVFGDIIGQYQQLGEGMLETAVRIVAEVAVVRDALAQSGGKLTENAIAIADALTQAAGSIEEFQKQFENYYDKFFTDTEKQARLTERLSGLLQGIFSPEIIDQLGTSRQAFRSVMDGLSADLDNIANQERFSLLLQLADAADQYYSTLESGAAAAQQAADEAAAAAQRAADEAAAAWNRAADAAIDAANRAAQANLTAAKQNVSSVMSSLRNAVQAEKASITEAYNAAVKTSQEAIDKLSDSVNKLTGLSNALKSALNRLVLPGTEGINRTAAQAQIKQGITASQSGNTVDIDAITDALNVVAEPSEQLFATFLDYQRDFVKTSNDISTLEDLTKKQLAKETSALDIAKTQLDVLRKNHESELARLDGILATAQEQVDAVNGTTTAVLSLGGAISSLAGAIAAQTAVQAAANAAAAAGGSGGSGGGGAGSGGTGGNGYTNYSASQITGYISSNNLNSAQSIYNAAVANNANIYSVGAALGLNATQTNAALSGVKRVPGFASGGFHKGGWAMVGEEGPELIDMPPSRVFSNSDSKNLLNMDELIAEVKALRLSNEETARSTKKTSDLLRNVTRDGQSLLTEAV